MKIGLISAVSALSSRLRSYSIDSSVKNRGDKKLIEMLESERVRHSVRGVNARFLIQGNGLIARLSQKGLFKPAEPRHYHVDGSDISRLTRSLEQSTNAYQIRLRRGQQTRTNALEQRTALIA